MAAKKTYSIYQLLQEDAPTTISAKLTSGEIISDATVICIATNGVKVLDTTANLVRYLNEWNTVYISVVPTTTV
jgi:hypothetical protein